MTTHAKAAAKTIKKRTSALSMIAAKSWGADTTALRQLYLGYVRPAGVYAAAAWFPYAAPTIAGRLESANYGAARVITGAAAGSNAEATCREAWHTPRMSIDGAARKKRERESNPTSTPGPRLR